MSLWLLGGSLGGGPPAAAQTATLSSEQAPMRSFRLLPYDANYFLVTQTHPINRAVLHYARCYANDLKPAEAKFQLSVAFSMWDNILGNQSWLGFSYTQRVWWQLLSPVISSPFRETNYEPQLFIAWRTPLSRWG